MPRERGWPLRDDLMRGIDPAIVRIRVDAAGGIHLNGKPVGATELARHVRAIDRQSPPPALRLDHDREAPCAALEAVRRTLDALPMCRAGRCAERTAWERTYGPPVPPPG
ncbi:hypothetical protein [Sphingomonas sp. VNH70]|uniref:ExbD/TolR family protein n=1 Tax=Sphingomonas silueang TaxID=3156617 RepID=UPI0032B617CF